MSEMEDDWNTKMTRLLADMRASLAVMEMRSTGAIEAGIEQLEKHANEEGE